MRVETTQIRMIRAAGVAGLVFAVLTATNPGLSVLLLRADPDAWADS